MSVRILHVVVWTVFLATYAAPGGEMRTWTDSAGTGKLRAELVTVEGDRVVLKKPGGRPVALTLSDFCAKDQDYLQKHQAAKKAAAPVRRRDGYLPVFGAGEHKGDHAVYSGKTFDAVVRERGVLVIYPKDDAGNRITDPRLTALMRCASSDEQKRTRYWKLKSFEGPAEPAVQPSVVHIRGTREAQDDEAAFDLVYEFKEDEITIWHRSDIPRALKDNRMVNVSCEVGKVKRVVAMETAQEAKSAVAGWEAKIKPAKDKRSKSKKSRALTFHESQTLRGEVEQFTVSGGVFGPRIVSFIAPRDKATHVLMYNYQGMPLYEGFRVNTRKDDPSSDKQMKEQLIIRIQ